VAVFRLLPLIAPQVHEPIQLVLMEPDGPPRSTCLEAPSSNSPPQRDGTKVGVLRRLLVSEVWVLYCSRLNHFLGLSIAILRLHFSEWSGRITRNTLTKTDKESA